MRIVQVLNAAGQRMAAELMTDYLLAHGLPRAGKAAGSAPPPNKNSQ